MSTKKMYTFYLGSHMHYEGTLEDNPPRNHDRRPTKLELEERPWITEPHSVVDPEAQRESLLKGFRNVFVVLYEEGRHELPEK